MIEWVVIAGCIGSNVACTNSLQAYYQYDTPLTRQAKYVKQVAEDYYKDSDYLRYTLPVAAAIVKKEATIKINSNWSLKASNDFIGPLFSYGF